MQPPQSPAAADAPQSLWAELRDALRGTNADYTRIPLRRAVFLLAVPMVQPAPACASGMMRMRLPRTNSWSHNL